MPVLPRLVVHLTHDCNLRCTYCYAQGGAYGGPRHAITPDTLSRALDWFFGAFERIDVVQFFGGEPLLNPRGLGRACAEIEARCAAARRAPPKLTLVTNGTVVTPPVLDLIARHGIRVTVSLDGDAPIHDAARVDIKGRGSFARVVANIEAMKAATGQPSQIEGTLTGTHRARGFDLPAFMDFLAQRLDVHLLHLPWVMTGFGEHGVGTDAAAVAAVVEIFEAGIERSFASFRSPDLGEVALLSAVERRLAARLAGTREGEGVCGAGTGTLAVDVDGNIQPCFMFAGREALALGTLEDGPATVLARGQAFSERLALPPDQPRSALLNACAGLNLEQSGAVARLHPADLAVHRALAAKIDARLDALQAEPAAWSWIGAKMRLIQLMMG